MEWIERKLLVFFEEERDVWGRIREEWEDEKKREEKPKFHFFSLLCLFLSEEFQKEEEERES